MKILVNDKLSDGRTVIPKDLGYTVEAKTGLKPDELMGIIGMAVCKAGINIARLFLGRDRQEGTAINITLVDAEVSKKVIEKIGKARNVLSVQEVFI